MLCLSKGHSCDYICVYPYSWMITLSSCLYACVRLPLSEINKFTPTLWGLLKGILGIAGNHCLKWKQTRKWVHPSLWQKHCTSQRDDITASEGSKYPALWCVFWVIFTSVAEFCVFKGSRWFEVTVPCSVMGDFSSRMVAGPGVLILDAVEEEDRLQLRHPSWLFYESVVINLIGCGQAFSVPQRASWKWAVYLDKRPWLHPRMLGDFTGGWWRVSGVDVITGDVGTNGWLYSQHTATFRNKQYCICTVQWLLFLELLQRIVDVREKCDVSGYRCF